MSVRKYPSRALSIEEWEVIVRGLEALEFSLEEEFRVTGKSNPTVDEDLLATLKTEFAENIETYKMLEPDAKPR